MSVGAGSRSHIHIQEIRMVSILTLANANRPSNAPQSVIYAHSFRCRNLLMLWQHVCVAIGSQLGYSLQLI